MKGTLALSLGYFFSIPFFVSAAVSCLTSYSMLNAWYFAYQYSLYMYNDYCHCEK